MLGVLAVATIPPSQARVTESCHENCKLIFSSQIHRLFQSPSCEIYDLLSCEFCATVQRKERVCNKIVTNHIWSVKFVCSLTTLFQWHKINSGGWMMNWKERGRRWSCSNFEVTYYPSMCLEKPRKTMKKPIRITGLRAEIWTRDLPNTTQEHLLVFLISFRQVVTTYKQTKILQNAEEDYFREVKTKVG
jgi:hypothetical protein